MRGKRDLILLFSLSIITLFLFVWSISVGDVDIRIDYLIKILSGEKVDDNSWSFIVERRLNRAIMAILAGGALAVTGGILQVYFRNPLAGPGVLGINSGVTLGVAAVVLGGFTFSGVGANMSIVISGLLGAGLILFILTVVSKFIKQSITLLIVGLMLSYFTSAFVDALYLWADEGQSRQFGVWGLGSFEGVSSESIYWILPFLLISICALFLLIKPLNAFALGLDYAKSMGVNIKRTKLIIIVISSILTGVVTIYCGPVAFIGIAVPQIVRGMVKSKSHQFILPVAIVFGALFGLSADLIIRLSGNLLPLNTITSLIGAPIIIWTIIKMNKKSF